MTNRNLVMLQVVARGLEELLPLVVFVGGTTAGLYATDAAAPAHRGTDDVDCVVEVTTYSAYTQLQEKLYKKGFQPSQEPKDPICRFTYQSIIVDIMPIAPEVLGFSNKWYPAGIAEAQTYRLPDSTFIKILQPEYFIATKLQAFAQRGNGEYRWSQDFDDIVYVLDTRPEIVEEILQAPENVRHYIQEEFKAFLLDKYLEEGISAVLPYESGPGRVAFIKKRMEAIADFYAS